VKSAGKLYTRTRLILPRIDEFDTFMYDRVEKISLLLPMFKVIEPEQIYRSDPARLESFSHALSQHFELSVGFQIKHCRSHEEKSVLQSWELVDDDLRGSQPFRQAIARLNHGFLNDRSKFRRDRIFINSDVQGNGIEFPDVDATLKQMEWLRENIINASRSCPPLLTAIACLPIITNSHLFFDGNGRTSRALFNHLLHRLGLPSDVYLPVYEIMIASRGGFLIRLRQIETQNLWEPFVTFVLDFLDLCKEIGDP
jgi:Fic family protein